MKQNKYFFILTVFISCLLVTGCGKSKKSTPTVTNQAIAVAVIPAKIEEIQIKYQSSGTLTPITNPTIKAEISSRVTQINTSDGAAIKANQILATLNHTQQQIAYQQARAKLQSAQATLKEKNIEKTSNGLLVQKGIVSKLDYAKVVASAEVAASQVNEAEQNLLQAEDQLERTLVRSPIDGYVEKLYVSQGDYVEPGTPLFKLINHTLLQARLPFSQLKAGQFKIGQEVHLLSPATPGKEYIGQITAITPSIDPTNRALDVIVTLQSEKLWHAGASIQGHVFLEQTISATLIPEEGIVLRGNQNLVFTVVNGKAVQHTVTILQEENGNAAITGDIKNGDLLVTDGAQYLSQGTPVAIQPTKPVAGSKAQ